MRENGFTLVELAIALMVIGLLIGGVLKGQELIENARVTQTIRQIKSYDAATLIFRNTYSALPGDIKRPNRIPNCTEELCNIGGNGNGKVRDSMSDDSIEHQNFFTHLTKAGMIQGPEGGTQAQVELTENADLFYPLMPIDGINAVIVNYQYTPSSYPGDGMYLQEGQYYELRPVPLKSTIALDAKMDDGFPETGSVQEESNSCVDYSSPDKQYNASYDGTCILYVQAGF